ncbi:protein regulator of cytokinesis 1-like [Drosophila innubila]|uniref:protein regulator of cytokinesis 1-like n=1 Tax=Drosophila innubila TaxID=198719 RepID=UPI00148D198D|nr:protein regulator of cytokinesis 1-like [Drosophila innubila]
MDFITKSAILATTSEHFDKLYIKWSHMFDSEYCEELMHKLKERVRNFYTDLLTESDMKERLIRDGIRALREEASEVRRLLHKSVEDIGEMPEDMPLTVWQQRLDDSIEHLREELRQRRAEICELLLQQKQLCDELGELPLPLLADPLPKPQEMIAFSEHLTRLRAERTRRMEELSQLRSQIKQDMKVLELIPQTAADEQLLSPANQCLTPDIFECLRFMQQEFRAQVVELHERIDDMRQKIHVLWDRLQETDEFGMRRVREATAYTQRTYDVLHEELQRCQQLRSQNLKTFIERLRLEISKWWDLTLKSEQERKRFSNYYNDCYNEDLLELHELELDDLKMYYNNNKEIFELFASRAEFWARMEALEAKANEPNRFNNRGGQLLKEERERKAIGSKLPKIEQQITELVQAYVLRTRSPFLVHGENILEHMASDWVRLRQAKEQQSSARKHAPSGNGKMLPPGAGATAPRTPLSLRNASAMSASTMSLRRTPSNWQLAAMTSSTAKSTGNLHKRKLQNGDSHKPETPHAKRNLMKTLSALKASPTVRKPSHRLQPVQPKAAGKSPMKKVRVLADTMRRSSGVGRRSMGLHSAKKARSKAPVPEIRIRGPSDEDEENDGFETDDTYDSFENRIQSAARSSILPPQIGSSIRPLKLRKRL